jgi:S-adenosylmethionine synthetase
MVFGEITTSGTINIEQIARQAIKEVGYDDMKKGFDYKNATVIVAIDK